jgi:DNA-binding NarL/FixJ family response regulator
VKQAKEIRVAIIDDHAMVRAGVRAELQGQVAEFRDADGVAAGVALVREFAPDVVLLDIHMPDGGGVAVLRECQESLGNTAFLALSVSDAAADVIAAVRAGARGYVTKSISGPELIDAIERVANGDAVFSARLAGFVLDAFVGAPAEADEELDRLTPREKDVMRLLARGYTYKEIAAELFLSIKTIETHASAVLRKLQLSNRRELSRWASHRNLG